MPAIARLDWIQTQIRMGRSAFCSLGPAQDPTKVKLKVTLAAPAHGPMHPLAAQLVIEHLSLLRQAVSTCIVMDRGHRHSNGSAEVCFWFSAPPGWFRLSGEPELPEGGPTVDRSEPIAVPRSPPEGGIGSRTSNDCDTMIDSSGNNTITHFYDHGDKASRYRGHWEALPTEAWCCIHSRFAAFRLRNGPGPDDQFAAEWSNLTHIATDRLRLRRVWCFLECLLEDARANEVAPSWHWQQQVREFMMNECAADLAQKDGFVSWEELAAVGFHPSHSNNELYGMICKALHRGSRDPRRKGPSFAKCFLDVDRACYLLVCKLTEAIRNTEV
jgi:hypothetical protein